MATSIIKSKKSPKAPTSKSAKTKKSISEEDIKRRAYEIYLQNGDSFSDAQEDWLKAERELKGNNV